MVQVKIYGLKTPLMAHSELLSAAIHGAIVEALVYSPEKKFHRLIRSENYTIIEISMFEGRSIETKKSLIRLIFANIEREVGIRSPDVEITIYETPKYNWGIRGLCGDELVLGSKVDV
jgi:phenylpyruvate tautomerase PptA (4-oxalocrotonate tautomerase family)